MKVLASRIKTICRLVLSSFYLFIPKIWICKETEIGHIFIVKEYELIHYQQRHSCHIRLYDNFFILIRIVMERIFFYIVGMPRTRKDCETLLNSRFTRVLTVRRENDRLRIPKRLDLSMITVIYDIQWLPKLFGHLCSRFFSIYIS